jgi:ribosomal-protein-alanine N-acetyltransferase
VSVVPMTAGHVSALMRYEDELFGSEAWSADAYRDEIADTRSRHYLAAVDGAGELLAWGGIRVVGDCAEVLTVGVIPAARRGALRAGCPDATWEQRPEAPTEPSSSTGDNLAARRLYERRFAQVGRRRGYDAGRVDAVVMRKELPR